MKPTNKLILVAAILLFSTATALSGALANTPAAATDAAQEVVKQSTGDMAKDAAAQVADSAKEKAIVMAKDQANKAVDAGMNKATEALNPTSKAVDAAAGAAQ